MSKLDQSFKISQWVFDLDGTLSNPRIGMLDSLNYALREQGFPILEESRIDSYIGPPLEATLGELAGTDEPSVITRLVTDYRDHYHHTGFSNNELYPGIAELLKSFHSSSMVLGVCTAKTEPIARKILDHFAIEGLFSFVSGGDVGVTKGSQLSELLKSNIIDHHSLMIGDRNFDLIAAHENGVRACAVTWGFGGLTELQSEQPEFIVDLPSELSVLASRLGSNPFGGAEIAAL